jgi:hypothetical protein
MAWAGCPVREAPADAWTRRRDGAAFGGVASGRCTMHLYIMLMPEKWQRSERATDAMSFSRRLLGTRSCNREKHTHERGG